MISQFGFRTVILYCCIHCIYPFILSRNSQTPPHVSRALFSTKENYDAAALRSMTFRNLEKAQEPQLLCDFLMEIGACSTSITDSDRDTKQEMPIYLDIDSSDDPWDTAAVICGDHAVGKNVWNKCDVSAHFAASTDLLEVAKLVQDTLSIRTDYQVDQVPDRDWVIHVQQSWKPILVNNIILRFPWHSDDDVKDIIGDLKIDFVELQLEGGVAFGTGDHPTTQLCLGWVQGILKSHNISKLMDYGSGSGILGMAACAIDSSLDAVGVDIDIDAVRIANANAVINKSKMKTYLPPLLEIENSECKSVLMKAYQKGGEQVLPAEFDAPIYDALVANILAAPLVSLAPRIAELIKPGGFLGLSGILVPQAASLMETYSEFFDDIKIESKDSGWALVTGIRNNIPASTDAR